MKAQIVFVFWAMSLSLNAQSDYQWEKYLNEVMSAEDMESAEWEDSYEMLCELAQHPLDLNHATREDLEQLPFLSAQQVEEIMEYIYRYGPMKSLAELQMIRSLDYDRRRLLCCLVFIDEDAKEKEQRQYGRSELLATVRVPFYERKGDEAGYLGYPYRHWVKYQFTYGNRLKAGIVGAQDAGEPFFANKNRKGYDFYSAYLQLNRLGRIENLVVGKYRASLGMGLIINNSFALGKLSALQNLGRSTTTLRPHSSRSAADYLNGVGATINIAKGLSATAFFSYRNQDATLKDDGTVSSIITSGYHRTETEISKKNNLKNTTIGGSIRYQNHGLHGALNIVGTHLNRELNPNTNILYRKYYPQGYDFLNFSSDYGYVHPRFSFNGETAINKDGAFASVNSLSLRLNGEMSMMALHRFYSYRYTSLYSRCFSDGGRIQNENGIYLGASWKPSPRWNISVYTDYAYFPYPRYQVSQPSHSWDNLLQATYTSNKWTLSGRYRFRIRQKDNNENLINLNEHRGRITAVSEGRILSRTQLDFSMITSADRHRGYMLSETLGFTYRWLRLHAGFGYFHTDDYDSRIYLYEQGPLYNYSLSQYYGQGIRYWMMGRANIGKRLMLTAKIGTTNYFDRSEIGTSYQQVKASSLTDLDLQLRWKF